MVWLGGDRRLQLDRGVFLSFLRVGERSRLKNMMRFLSQRRLVEVVGWMLETFDVFLVVFSGFVMVF